MIHDIYNTQLVSKVRGSSRKTGEFLPGTFHREPAVSTPKALGGVWTTAAGSAVALREMCRNDGIGDVGADSLGHPQLLLVFVDDSMGWKSPCFTASLWGEYLLDFFPSTLSKSKIGNLWMRHLLGYLLGGQSPSQYIIVRTVEWVIRHCLPKLVLILHGSCDH